jgi:hypothetical protein
MVPERRARITWSLAQVKRGLPVFTRTIDPAWFDADPPGAEGWSLQCRFETTPAAQGNPSPAAVAFLVEGAPHERLVPGVRLWLYERGTGHRAVVEVLDCALSAAAERGVAADGARHASLVSARGLPEPARATSRLVGAAPQLN